MILEISFTIFLILLVLVFSFWGKIKRKYRQRFLFTPIERQLVQLYNLNQYSEFVDHFNKFNIKANISDYNGTTLLMSILHKSHSYKYVDFLLKNGADPNKQDGAGRTALMMACYWNEKEIVQLLLEYNVNMDVSIYIRGKSIIDVNPVMACFYKEYYDLANLLLTKGASPYVVEETAKKTNRMKILKPKALNMLEFYKRRDFREKVIFARLCQKAYIERTEIDLKTTKKPILLAKIPEIYFSNTIHDIF